MLGHHTREAKEDAAHLLPEYKAVVAARYDEDALLEQVFKASKVDEDRAFPDLQEATALTGMVAEHLASLPRPTTSTSARAAPDGV
jgi:hypothetical protein